MKSDDEWDVIYTPGWNKGLTPNQKKLANQQIDNLKKDTNPLAHRCGDFAVEPLTREWSGWFKLKPILAFGERNFRIILGFFIGKNRITDSSEVTEKGRILIHTAQSRDTVYEKRKR